MSERTRVKRRIESKKAWKEANKSDKGEKISFTDYWRKTQKMKGGKK